ncbi:hypothetical protein F4780DRAFT_775144 [Xylariomycetidae sp. FL0641]|nr:hypothetical protein F4780DRAFT_775144 [Xylariomycetidae sp. FL0641]
MSLAHPVTKDGFSFSGGDLFAEASGHNRHRRATPAELKEHFKSGSEKDRPAHWYEAQLIHYGLPPSKIKGTARMRLFDAVNAGKVSVPTHIKKLEGELKKEWTKQEREAKKTLKASSSSSSTTAKGTKRKAESSTVDMTVDVGGVSVTVKANQSASSQSAAKKTKSTAASSAPAKAKAAAAAPKKTTTAPRGRTKQTARRGGAVAARGRVSTAPPSSAGASSPSVPSQALRGGSLARRSGNLARRGGYSGGFGGHHGYDEDDGPPPPYSEYDRGYSAYDDDDDDDDGYDYGAGNRYNDDDDDPDESSDLQPLGLLNGRYALRAPDVTEEWPQWEPEDLSLVLTLAGTELWGRLSLGVVEGVLRLPQRPWQPSPERLAFTWRGQEQHQGPILHGDANTGWLRFLGGGRVEGQVDFMGLRFRGTRDPGQGTRSQADARALRGEWDGYSEAEYERLNRARWG